MQRGAKSGTTLLCRARSTTRSSSSEHLRAWITLSGRPSERLRPQCRALAPVRQAELPRLGEGPLTLQRVSTRRQRAFAAAFAPGSAPQPCRLAATWHPDWHPAPRADAERPSPLPQPPPHAAAAPRRPPGPRQAPHAPHPLRHAATSHRRAPTRRRARRGMHTGRRPLAPTPRRPASTRVSSGRGSCAIGAVLGV